MKPIIKSYHSLEMFYVDEDYRPEDLTNFGFTFELQIGMDNSKVEEVFSFFVCSPKWLLEHCSKEEVMLGLHYLIMAEFDFKLLIEWLNAYVNNCTGETWEEIVQKLSRLGRWESDDFTKWPENMMK